MRNIFASAVAFTLGAASVANASIGLCGNVAYADGGIYCREDSQGSCLSNLGNFPAQTTFPFHMEIAADKNMYLAKVVGHRTYIRYRDHAYLDTSPGALAPVRFTPDNSTLAPGETSWSWASPYGIIMFTPTGNLADTSTPTGGVASGIQWVNVPGYPGLKRVYWNQTLWQGMRAGTATGGTAITMCHGDYDPTIIQGDRP